MDILYYSSADPVKSINNCSDQTVDVTIQEEQIKEVDTFINDHDSHLLSQNIHDFSNFSKQVIYVAGFVVHKLLSTLKCETCKKGLCSNDKELFLNSLIELKNKGEDKGVLNYTSKDVILVCMQAEKEVKVSNYQNRTVSTLFLQS